MSAGFMTSILNYLYYPIMGRLMGVSSYGELQIITSFLLQLTTVFVGLNLISVNIVANHDESEAGALMIALQKTVFWLIALACIGMILAGNILKNFFHFSSAWPFLLIAPALLIDALSVFWTGYLQGHKDFKSLSVYTLSTGLGKIIFSVVLVILGLGVSSGPLGIALGLLLSLIIVRFVTKHDLPSILKTLQLPQKHEIRLIKAHLVFIIEVIIALISMSVLLSIDILLVKHLFSAQYAGQYAGIATIARILFYASAPIVSVMLPAIKIREHRESQAAFRRTILVSLGICAIGLSIFALIPHFIVHLFLGGAFTSSAHWLPLLGIIAVLVTLTNIIINYLLALRSHLAVVIGLVSLAVGIPLILIHHATIEQIVMSASSGLLSGQLIFWVTFIAKRGKVGQHSIAPVHVAAD